MSTTAAADRPVAAERLSPWAPMHNRVFAALLCAQIASHVGTFFQSVAAAWLMGDLSGSPLLVALIPTATLFPTLILGMPAGALADIVDRRKMLIGTQLWLFVCAATLAGLTIADLTTPAVLLILTFCLGIGNAAMRPAWQAIQPDLVPREEFGQAVALSSMAFNVGRSIGPAVGGVLVAAAGAGSAFVVHAISYGGIVAVLLIWRPRADRARIERERLAGAMRAGWRYSVNSPVLRAVLIRIAAFAFPAATIQSLLPSVVRDQLGLGSGYYGLMLGAFGAGAVSAALFRPRIDEAFTPDRIMVYSSWTLAVAMVIVGVVTWVPLVFVALAVGGAAWTTSTVTANVSAQSALPWWVRARGLGMYMIVLAGGMALGSAAAGAIAAWSIPGAHLLAAAALVGGSFTVFRWRLGTAQTLDLTPAQANEPIVELEPAPDAGPVLVTIHYRVTPQHQLAFGRLMRVVERERRRSGAEQWGLFRDLVEPDLFLETFVVETWAEHVRQHHRKTVAADAQMRRVRDFVEGDVTVAHLVSAYATDLRPE